MPKDIAELKITSMNYYGDGTAGYMKKIVAVPGTFPGDIVLASIPPSGAVQPKGKLVRIVKPSGIRVKSNCPARSKGCGGCPWLEMEYGKQLVWKTGIVKNLINSGVKNQADVKDIIGMEFPVKYRNKMSMLNRSGKLVFMQENSQKEVFLESCPMETEENSIVYGKLKNMSLSPEILQVHMRSARDGTVGLCFFAKKMSREIKKNSLRIMKEIKSVTGIGVSSYHTYNIIEGRDYIEQEVGNITYSIPLNGFFQTNYIQAGVLQNLVMEAVSGDNRNILDLYCGSGFFSLPAALKAERVVGIENNIDAIKTAVMNSGINKIGNAEFIASDVKASIKEIKPGFFGTVILNPPRMGCGAEVIAGLIRLKPEKLVYISCSPEVLSADLKLLTDKSYKMVSCRPVDMFPHTFHIETVAVLEKV